MKPCTSLKKSMKCVYFSIINQFFSKIRPNSYQRNHTKAILRTRVWAALIVFNFNNLLQPARTNIIIILIVSTLVAQILSTFKIYFQNNTIAFYNSTTESMAEMFPIFILSGSMEACHKLLVIRLCKRTILKNITKK